MVLVRGDTTTAFVTALACYYMGVSVGHVEAGLRTYNVYSLFPEEFNRQGISLIANYHFAPIKLDALQLIGEDKLWKKKTKVFYASLTICVMRIKNIF